MRRPMTKKEIKERMFNAYNKKGELTTNFDEIESLVIVVDMVNGFVKVGPMSTPYMKALIPEISKIIKSHKRPKRKVAFVKEDHDEDCTEFKKFPGHCKKGDYEAQIIEEYDEYLNESLIYNKNSTSAIFAPGFLEDIRKMKNLKRIIIVGGCTDICSMNVAIPLINYFDQINKEVEIILPKNANDTYDAPNHNRDEYNEMAYKFMMQAGIKVVDRYVDDEELVNVKKKTKKESRGN